MDKQKKNREARIFALNSNQPLAEKMSEASGIPMGKATINHFSDGEIQVTIDESIRGDDVYIVQSLSEPVNDNFMELMIMIDAVRRTSSHTINVVMPYYGYSRFDLKNKPREPITAKMIANLMQNDGVSRVITLDLHAPQIQGFFDIPVDHLRSRDILADHLRKHGLDQNAVVASPDYNGVARARSIANILELPIAIIDNREPDDSSHIPSSIIGDVKGKNAIIFDDMILSGEKMRIAAEALKKNGAEKVYVVATHPVFTDEATKNLSDTAIDKVIVTDSVVIPEDKKIDNLEIVSVGKLLGKALNLIQNDESTSDLFKLFN